MEDTRLAPNTGAADHPHPIDRVHLSRYTFGDIRLEREILDLFLGQLPVTLGALRGAATEREWYVAAHTLKGSGRAVGAWRIAHLAQDAERVNALSDRASARAMIARIEEAAREIEAYVAEAMPVDSA